MVKATERTIEKLVVKTVYEQAHDGVTLELSQNEARWVLFLLGKVRNGGAERDRNYKWRQLNNSIYKSLQEFYPFDYKGASKITNSSIDLDAIHLSYLDFNPDTVGKL